MGTYGSILSVRKSVIMSGNHNEEHMWKCIECKEIYNTVLTYFSQLGGHTWKCTEYKECCNIV